MSAKSKLFFSAMGKSKPMFKPFNKYAEGGMAEEEGPENESTEGEDTSVSPEEKLAAYEILECISGSINGVSDQKSKAERLAKALKAFFLMVDAAPHAEGPHEGEGPEGMS